jgi:hypothetical protein
MPVTAVSVFASLALSSFHSARKSAVAATGDNMFRSFSSLENNRWPLVWSISIFPLEKAHRRGLVPASITPFSGRLIKAYHDMANKSINVHRRYVPQYSALEKRLPVQGRRLSLPDTMFPVYSVVFPPFLFDVR